MTPSSGLASTNGCRRALVSLAVALGLSGLVWSSHALAQAASSRAAVTKPQAEQGARWGELKPAQQATLKPLEREWAGISSAQKDKWIELATRFPRLTPDRQARIQARMAEWARLTPLERGQARLNFQEAKELPPQDRQERWKAYQALSPEQRQQFAERAAPAKARADSAVREPRQPKSNIVPNPAFAAAPKAIAPTVVQARPGATTTSVTKRPAPPTHQQTGLPKIAATPEFVNKATLLPQRGPQGAATRSATAPAEKAASQQ